MDILQFLLLWCYLTANFDIWKRSLDLALSSCVYPYSISRPDIIEAEATNRAISLSRLTNTPVLFVHISSKEAIEAIRNAQSKGFKILAETCPQYLFLTKDKLDQKDFEGAKYVCSPPPRTKEDQLEVWKGIQNGTFDVFSSDHCPFFLRAKKVKT